MGRIITPGRKGAEPVRDYNMIDTADSDEINRAKLEFFYAKAIGTKLTETYKGRMWGVMYDSKNGILVITCPTVSSTKGYHLHVRNDTLHVLQDRAIKAAGEILERYGVSRARVVDEHAVEARPRTGKDEMVVATPSDTAPDKSLIIH